MATTTTPRSEMSLTKTLAGAAALLCVVAYFTAPRNITPSAFGDIGETFFPDFEDPNIATTLEVIEFDDATAAAKPFKVTNEAGIWTIPSHHNYPADGKDRLAQTAAGVIGIVKEDFRSDNVADHESLGVVDPLDETTTSLSGRGKRVTLKGDGEQVLADFIVGNEIEGREGYHFIRVPGQKRVYSAKLALEISTKFEDWIEKDLLEVEQTNIDQITLRDYSINERTLMVDDRDTLVLDKSDGNWAANRMPASREVDTAKMNTLLSDLNALSIVGVRPKPEGVTESLRRIAEGDAMPITREDVVSLQSRGYYFTRTGDLLSNEGELQARTIDGIRYTLRFGEVLYGTGDAVSAGTDQSDDSTGGPGDNRYLFISAEFDRSLLPEPAQPSNRDFEGKEDGDLSEADRANKDLAQAYDDWQQKVTEAEELAAGLSRRFAKWYYVISDESFRKVRLSRADLVKTKDS